MGKEEDENKVALDDQSPPLMLKKKMKTKMHWMTKARVWRKIKPKVSNGSQSKQSVRRLARRLAPHETCPATPMTLWEFLFPMRLDLIGRTSPNDEFDQSLPLLDTESWEPRSLGY